MELHFGRWCLGVGGALRVRMGREGFGMRGGWLGGWGREEGRWRVGGWGVGCSEGFWWC